TVQCSGVFVCCCCCPLIVGLVRTFICFSCHCAAKNEKQTKEQIINMISYMLLVCVQEWEKLNYDIHTLRYARREVRSRWKKILLQLGYQCEVDSLLCVNTQSHFRPDQEHFGKAADLLKQLLDHTSLFPPKTEHQNRYLYVMDRLVSLDSAEDFIKLAKQKYPKKEGPELSTSAVDCPESWVLHYEPFHLLNLQVFQSIQVCWVA
uniref:Melanoregulin n=1 Tax=Poecilia mexicana TaxID=48701 RepID=A0A3B3Y2C9_9TELE